MDSMVVALPFRDADFFVRVRDFASQSFLNRLIAYFVALLVSAVLTTGIFILVGAPMTAVYMLPLMMLLFALSLLYIDPEGEYTKEDVLVVFALAAIMPGIAYFIKMMGTGMVSQFAAPLIMLQETASQAGAAVAQGAAGNIGSLGWYLGMFMMYMGMLGGAFGIAELFRAE